MSQIRRYSRRLPIVFFSRNKQYICFINTYPEDTPFREGTLKDLAKSVLEISEKGLKRRKNLDEKGRDESLFLKSLKAIAETGITPAEEILEKYFGEWGQKIDRIYEDYSY